MRRIAVGLLVLALGARGPFCGNGKLNLSNAHVKSSYVCPIGSSSADYKVDGTLDADNQTSATVTIKSMTMEATVVGFKGNWFDKSMGAKSTSADFPFSPKTVSAGSKTTIHFTTPWSCTNPAGNTGSYADFAIALMLDTTAGKLKITANKHRLQMS